MADAPKVEIRLPSQRRSGYARHAIGLMRANDEVGARGRHAIARAFVYALLDLADAIRNTAPAGGKAVAANERR